MTRATTRIMRWWMIGLVMLGAIINYLTRSTLAVAAPTLLTDLQHHHAGILLDRRHVPDRDHAAADLRLRARRARPQARPGDLRHGLVAHQHGARPGAQLADARRAARPAGIRRGLGESRRHEGDRRVVPRAGSAASPAASTTSAPRSARCWRRRWWSGRSSPTTGRWRSSSPAASAWSGSGLWLLAVPVARRRIRGCRTRSARYIAAGQESHLRDDGRRPSIAHIARQRNFWGIALPRFLADPTWGTLTFWVPLYLTHGAALRPEADRAVRLDAVSGRRPRVPVRRRRWCSRCRSAA